MKKILVMATAVVAIFASNVSLAENKETKVKVQPKIALRVLDTSGKVVRDTGSLSYSVSNKNLMLCWDAFDMEFQSGKQNNVVEIFVAPNENVKFMKQGATVRKVDNSVTVNSLSVATNGDKLLQSCWLFDNTDPLGKYSLSVQINDIIFDSLSFELVK